MFSNIQKIALIALVLAASFVWYVVFTQAHDGLRVAVLNVGQGDSIFFETPSGSQVLIDGGPGRAVLAELGRVMPAYDRSIDMIIATHTDNDHLAGLVEVIKNYSVGMVAVNGASASTTVFENWQTLLKEKHPDIKIVRAGDRALLDHGVTLDFLGPFNEDFMLKLTKPNEAMVVSRLAYGESSFLFMGDIEKGDELRLAQSGADIESDVLKVAHHGSKYTSTDLFLNKVRPAYEVISVGARNTYGHPAPETLERLGKIGAKLFRTDRSGRVIFSSDGASLRVE